MSLDVVILAAGKGTRMHSSQPKVLHPLAGRPLLRHVVDTARALRAERIVVVYGHGGEQVRSAFDDEGLVFVLQDPQLGTGHAVQQAAPALKSERTLILYGDVPLTRVETLARAVLDRDGLSLITAHLEDATGYGRIVRDATGRVVRIVEESDSTPDEKAIREINTGILAAPTTKLKAWLHGLRDDNAQGEIYLTDIVARAVAERVAIHTLQPSDTWEILGVNSKQQLAELERVLQRERAAQLLARGVTLLDPARIDVRGELTCGQDVSIDVNCIFEGKVILGDGASVGANCVLKDTTVEAGARILPFCHIDGARIGPDSRIGPYARMRPGADLAAHTHVGNFVEIKNAQTGRGLQSQPPELSGRRNHRAQREHRGGHHHLQLRRRQQAPHRDRGRSFHRLRHPAGGAGHGGQRRDDRRGQHDRQGRTGRRADRVARQAGYGQELEEAGEASKVRGQLIVDRSVACLADNSIHALSFRTADN